MKNVIRMPLLLSLMTLSLVACQTEEFAQKDPSSLSQDEIKQICEYSSSSLESCQQVSNICQPAFDESQKFYACVPYAEPRYDDLLPINDPGENNELNPSAPIVPSPDAPIVPSPDEPIGSGSGPTPVYSDYPNNQIPITVIKDDSGNGVVACENLHPRFLVKKGNGMPKVLICHNGRNPHNIVVACPAVKAHLKHKNYTDTLGSCLKE